MATTYFNLSQIEQETLLNEASAQTGKSALILEKDIWVCWALKAVFELSQPMSFKGGTSLSKVYGLISRFSEDVDLTIDYQAFMPTLDIHQASKTSLKKSSDMLKQSLKNYLSTTALPHLKTLLEKDNLGKKVELAMDEAGETIFISYESALSSRSAYIRNAVRLEFGARNTTSPNEQHVVTSDIASLFPDIQFPSATIQVLSPVRTFWEKATLMHVECHRNRELETPERLSRHWYDLAKLGQSWVAEKAYRSPDIFEDVLSHKLAFYNASYANYETCLKGHFVLIPNELNLNRLSIDYESMVNAAMFDAEIIPFQEILAQVESIQNSINHAIAQEWVTLSSTSLVTPGIKNGNNQAWFQASLSSEIEGLLNSENDTLKKIGNYLDILSNQQSDQLKKEALSRELLELLTKGALRDPILSPLIRSAAPVFYQTAQAFFEKKQTHSQSLGR